MKFENRKIISILLLVAIILIASFIQEKTKKYENFDSGSYTATLLNTLGPIIYDSSTLSVDKIESLRKITPPIADATINSYINSNSDADAIITNIKGYLGSCPASSTSDS
jgi:hypothetical protein